MRRNITFTCTYSSWPCWLGLWSLCQWITGVNMLPKWRRSLCLPNNIFIFLWGPFCVDLVWWWTHIGRLWQNKLSKLFFHMHLHVVSILLKPGLEWLRKVRWNAMENQIKCILFWFWDFSNYIIWNLKTRFGKYSQKCPKHMITFMQTKYVCMGRENKHFELYNPKHLYYVRIT